MMDLRFLPGYVRYLYLTRLVVDIIFPVLSGKQTPKQRLITCLHLTRKSFQRKFRDLNKNVLTSYFV